LAPETTEETLREFFIQSGAEPLKIKIMKDRSERARPYAFAQFKVNIYSQLTTYSPMCRVWKKPTWLSRTLLIKQLMEEELE
jgi:hypothetical protein